MAIGWAIRVTGKGSPGVRGQGIGQDLQSRTCPNPFFSLKKNPPGMPRGVPIAVLLSFFFPLKKFLLSLACFFSLKRNIKRVWRLECRGIFLREKKAKRKLARLDTGRGAGWGIIFYG